MARCYACSQENCGRLKPSCTCSCHREEQVDVQKGPAPFRDIVRRTRVQEEHTGRRSWWSVSVTTVHLSCGHTKEYRGEGVPTKKVRCSQCK